MSRAPSKRPPSSGFVLDRANARYYGARSSHIIRAQNRVWVDGDYANLREIEARTGLSYTTVLRRVAEARKADKPLTWSLFARKDRRKPQVIDAPQEP